MQLNTLSPAEGRLRKNKRVGRGIGSGFGKTAGRGHKGLKSRSGGKVAPGFEGGQMPLAKRLPKYGFTSRIGMKSEDLRLSEIAKVDGDTVDLDSLIRANLIKRSTQRVKIFASGEINRAVTVVGLKVTAGARAAIEAAGGKVEDVPAAAE